MKRDPRPDHDRLVSRLTAEVGEHDVLARPIDRVAYASDASFYRLLPEAVVRPRSVAHVQRLFRVSQELGVPLTFRSAGTSLSGQAVTDGVLADVAHHWRRVEVLDGGRRVRVQPGVIGGVANRVLAPFGAKIGPDPASINACTLGGILANNSSGMCCGVAENAYHTLDSLTFVLPSGTCIDTASPEADQVLRAKEPALAQGLLDLRCALLAQPELVARIRGKYRTKNTTGYSLNALLDFDRPVDILRHLLIGSEGTLAFIAEAVLNTVPDYPVKYTGLLLFPGIRDACAAIPALAASGARALEVMDRAALRSVEGQTGVPAEIAALAAGAAGLLVEYQDADEAARPHLERTAAAEVSRLTLAHPARFTHAADEQARLWHIRKGMFPSVGSVRASGTTVIIEDVAFPVERLADAVVDLTALFHRHGYDNAIIFGHAKDGNLHFVLTQSFNTPAAIDQYARLMDDVVTLVTRGYDGALKAEHGTGRNMAPFVETEWGPEAVAIMRRVKSLVDPSGLLNPGVILNDDPRAHLADIKPLPPVEEEVDRCIECGYCEPQCPSRNLTLTPRQRIVVRREMARLRGAAADAGLAAALERDFPYDALDTCAVDGLCAVACPVAIDTGQLTKRFRRLRHRPVAGRVALAVARHFAVAERGIRLALRAGSLVRSVAGARAMPAITRAVKAITRGGTPIWLEPMPRPAAVLPTTVREGAAAVYFPACISRTMGQLPGEQEDMSLPAALVTVAARAGAPVWIPSDTAGCCCGVPFSSKGYVAAHRLAVARTIERFWTWSDRGKLPIVVDTSPCTYGLRTCRPLLPPDLQQQFDALTIVDALEFVADTLLPRLVVGRREARVVLHPVCSVVKLDLEPRLARIGAACADDSRVPLAAGCCGFAGDRGWLVPELTASATAGEAAEAAAAEATGYYSSSRTCEIGMTRATGRVYRSFLHLVERATRADRLP